MRWIELLKINKDADLRLICCPHSGGSASFFYPWINLLPQNIELAAIQLPGRETRLHEPLLNNMNDVIESLVDDVANLLEKPFLLLGHSLGGLIIFELAKKMQQYSFRLPEHLIVSGCRAPHMPLRREPFRTLPSDVFISKLAEYNGTSQTILQDRSMADLFLPILRADFTISETYQYSQSLPLQCKITALSGQSDPTVLESDILEWEQHTQLSFQHFTIPGDHFFIKSSPNKVIEIIRKIVETS